MAFYITLHDMTFYITFLYDMTFYITLYDFSYSMCIISVVGCDNSVVLSGSSISVLIRRLCLITSILKQPASSVVIFGNLYLYIGSVYI